LPSDCRPAIHAARLVYSEIGRNVIANGCDSVSGRAYVTGRRKLALLAEAMLAGRSRSSGRPHELAPEARYLVEAVARQHIPDGAAHVSTAFAASRTTRVLDIFEKLERTRAARRGRGAPALLAREMP
ncbi:MAG: phytoene/squalene synthase family protein, partial [Beijerinckiaceae bacterium]